MTILFNIADLVEENGRTIRQNNLDRQHRIPIGTLVQLIPWDEDSNEYAGVRLYVVRHTRDCDGTPLYSLGHRKGEMDIVKMEHGWSEEALTTVR